ncbi:hypothetical protein HDV00_005266 [Rhizophlyctis rosea]|nr:hypothetical protein HDV00_005266 [Rhizophlyctis rosea]
MASAIRLKSLPAEILDRILVHYVGQYLVRNLRFAEFLHLRLIDRTFGHILRRLTPRMMESQAAYFKGIVSQLHAEKPKSLTKTLPHLKILRNPLVPAHTLLSHLNVGDQARLIRTWAPYLVFIQTVSSSPIHMFGSTRVAKSCQYWVPPGDERNVDDSILILKAPQVQPFYECLYAVSRRKIRMLLITRESFLKIN